VGQHRARRLRACAGLRSPAMHALSSRNVAKRVAPPATAV
jgi:hypothetical protein